MSCTSQVQKDSLGKKQMNKLQLGQGPYSQDLVLSQDEDEKSGVHCYVHSIYFPSNSQHYNMVYVKPAHTTWQLNYEFLPTSLGLPYDWLPCHWSLKWPPPRAQFASLLSLSGSCGIRLKKRPNKIPDRKLSMHFSLFLQAQGGKSNSYRKLRTPFMGMQLVSSQMRKFWHQQSCQHSAELSLGLLNHFLCAAVIFSHDWQAPGWNKKVWSGHPEDMRVPGMLRAPHWRR